MMITDIEEVIRFHVANTQTWIRPQYSPVMNKSHESRIRAIRSAPRNSTELERLLRMKSRALERVETHRDKDRCMTELSVLRYIGKSCGG